MIRMLVFFAILLAAALGLMLLLETPGQVSLSYGGFEYTVTLAKAVLALAVIFVVLMLLWSLLRLIFRLPGLLSLSGRMRRRARGYSAVSRGMVSVGIGDRRAAQRFASDAERLLGREPMTLLLKAQAAQLSGDKPAAEQAFTRMLDNPEMKILGLRGLYVEARRNQGAEARTFAEEAFRLAPSAPWASDAVLEYRTADKDWRGALAVVDETASRRNIDRETARRQRATLLTASALDALDHAPDEAFRHAVDALKLNPGQVVAASLVARRHSAKGDYSKASKVIETAWKILPHPDLAEAYLDVRPGDSSLDRLKRARYLAKMAPNARESRLMVARAALDAREFNLAREQLESLVLDQPTARVCRLMAELEDKETGNVGLVRKWLSRASIAPRDPAWVADGFVSERWLPVSPVTGRIDAFAWIAPPQSLESQVRASIDADRVQALPEAEPVEATRIAPPEPETVTTVEPIPEPEPEPPATPAPEAQVAADAAAPATLSTRLPDDPGPRLPDGKQKKGWRLFG
ncbi:MAG: heme biosynthesis protein HemY [Proteobacteria bacterium]|nr:heme biosynthesis protein HemY [Pseudomonadota bacterium]